ncbi:AraC family transcriptional regulator [Spirosoma sp. RP8]|uniref:AraC family transcriptional regulator n=1 Tax=Spirosoma liriopis TaxID=2937440 RepID=A0ABT0HV01_9BACT|nr:helix-turn-helix domain-containing protein [Spirosoma liriopis]MCK8495335.1 AraC family transcriptional regulator [Spirosoma liriopis]
MKEINRVNSFSGESFLERYVQPGSPTNWVLNADVSRFFIVPLEAMSQRMTLPIPPTRITNHLMLFLEEGQALMQVGSQAYQIRPHQCLFVPAGQVFSFDQVEPNRGYLCNFHNDFIIDRFARPDFLNELEFLQVWGNPHVRVDGSTSQFVTHLLSRLLHHYTADGLTQPDRIQAGLITLLCEIKQAHQSLLTSPPTQALLLTNQFIDRLFTYLRTYHLVSDYATLLSISPNHLNKVVKATTGKSPSQWIDEALVLEAKVLLHQTQLPVSEIAALVGIFDPSYFSRLFKKHAGVTPLAFRSMIETS